MEWFQALPTDLQIYWGLALVGSLVLGIQTLLMLFGMSDDLHVGDVDTSPAGAHPAGLSLLSVRTVAAFFSGFGWTGIALTKAGLPVAVVLVGAFAVGGGLMLIIVWLMRTLTRLDSSGTLDYHNAIGQVATVCLPVPANLAGNGQVEVMVQGRLMVTQACTRHASAIPSQAKVKVTDQLDPTTLIVEPLV
jgi:hypothetical protein